MIAQYSRQQKYAIWTKWLVCS